MTTESRNKVILGLFLLVLLAGFILFALFVFQVIPGRQNHAAASTAQSSQTQSSTTASSSLAGRYAYAGEPRETFAEHLLVLTNIGYVTGYSESRHDPIWVCYSLHPVSDLHAPPRPQHFEVDARTRARVSQHDYTGSGYDRGHMAPNYAIAVCDGEQAQVQTFLMSNIIPQSPHLNREVWERLEQREIKVYAQRFRRIWVIDGPVFPSTPRRLASGVALPDACYKIIVEEEGGKPNVMAFIMPQAVAGTEPVEQFLTSVRDIEQKTGLDFFAEMPQEVQDRLESQKAAALW